MILIDNKMTAINVTLKDTSGQEDKILYPQTLWSNVENKPLWVTSIAQNGVFSGDYEDLSYDIETDSVSGAVTVDGSTPIYELTATGNISSISFTSAVPANGHSCHIIINSSSDYTVAISHGSTVTISDVTYTFICPNGLDVSLDVTADNYVELDLLRIGTNIYVRGI